MVRLLEPDARFGPNVAILTGLHWHISEEALLKALPPHISGSVTSCRCFADQACGASLGIFLMEFSGLTALYDFAQIDHVVHGCVGVPYLLHMTSGNWDRAGRLPDLPQRFLTTFDRAVEGYGREGFAIRAVELCTPNTLTEEGIEAMEAIRKRLRVE